MSILIQHGPIRVAKNKKYLEHKDGTPFFWLADTWWYGMTSRMKREDFKSLAADRKRKGFNVIQIVVGVPPEVDIFSKHAANEGGLPFIRHSSLPACRQGRSGIVVNNKQRFWSRFAPQNDNNLTINFKYFNEVDRKIKHLVDNDLVPCIFGAWGHHIDILGADLIKEWWGEIVSRYAKYPVVWCLTGEADIFPPETRHELHLDKKFFSYLPNFLKRAFLSFRSRLSRERNLAKAGTVLYLPKRTEIIKKTLTLDSSVASLPRNDIMVGDEIKERLKKWDEVAKYIKKIDKYDRPLTVHIQSRTTAAKLFGDPGWLDIDSIQSGHSKDSLNFMISAIKGAAKNKRPIINLEPWYEGILGDFGAEEQLLAFWSCIKAGAAGHSYGAHGLWQMATEQDNFMGHWGRSDWRKALNYKGAEAVGKAKRKLAKNWPIIMKSDMV